MKKGQMFIIAAIIVSIALILLREYFTIFPVIEEKRFLGMESLTGRTENIQAEYRNIVDVALEGGDVNASAAGQLYNFSQYVRAHEKAEILYMFVYVNKSRNEMQVVLGNFLGDTIDVLLNATGTVFGEQRINNLFSKETAVAVFYIPPENDGFVNITLEYELQDEIVKEHAAIDVSKNSQLLFYDFSLSSAASSLRVKDVYRPVLRQFVELPGPEQGPAYCGNSICDAGETCATCYRDCCPGQCGNNVCEGAYGETCSTCSADCGSCGGCVPPKCKDTTQGGGTLECCSQCDGNPECLGNCDPSC